MNIPAAALTIKNSKTITKTCESSDYYFGNLFLFNEVDCMSKTRPTKISSYQYFTQLFLTQQFATEIANEFGGYVSPQETVKGKFFLYFTDIDLAMNFCRSGQFTKLIAGY